MLPPCLGGRSGPSRTGMAATIRIQHLQWVVGAVAAFGCTTLGGTLVASNLTELSRVGRAVEDASRFGLVMAATDMISAERGPANAAMDPLGPSTEESLRRLAAIRAITDARLAEARAAAGPDAVAFEPVARLLAEGRAKVDAICARAPEERSGSTISAAIRAMFAVADEAATLRSEFGRRLLRHAPEVGAEVLLQAEASTLREQAGRLGSYAVMMLTGGLPSDEARLEVTRTRSTLRHLWLNLATFGKNHADDPAIGEALERVKTEFFAGSLPMAMDVFAEPTLRGSAAEFTRRYVPGLAAPTELKDRLGALTLRRIEKARESAIGATLASAGITASVVLALLWLGLTFRNRLFRPLAAMREEILALSVGRLEEPAPRAPCGPEVDGMFAGLAVLRGELRRKVVLERARRRMNRNLKVLAQTDSLTSLLNRRAVSDQAPAMTEQAARSGLPVTAILVDIDHFKMVNDRYGHAGGDAVLRRVAMALKSVARPGDLLARYGGEEFLILAAGLDEAAGLEMAERMRIRLAAPDARQGGPPVTGSFGVACREPDCARDWEALVARADTALYRAKRLGRNRVCTEAPAAALVHAQRA